MKKVMVSTEYNSPADGINVTSAENGYIVDIQDTYIFEDFKGAMGLIQKELGVPVEEYNAPTSDGLTFRITEAANGFVLSMARMLKVYKDFHSLAEDVVNAIAEDSECIEASKLKAAPIDLAEIERLMADESN